jgi:hypothetical protein
MERQAKKRARDHHESYEFAFRRRYNLPPTDPRYLNATRDQIIEDYWLHYYASNGIKDEIEDESFDLEETLARMEQGDDWEDIVRG